MRQNRVPMQERISTERAKELARMAVARTALERPTVMSATNPMKKNHGAQVPIPSGMPSQRSLLDEMQKQRHSRRSLTFTAAGHEEMTASLAPMLGLQNAPVLWERLAKRQSFFEPSAASNSGEGANDTFTKGPSTSIASSSSGLTLRALRKHLNRLGGEVSKIHFGQCYICSEWGRVAKRTCCAATRHFDCEVSWQRSNKDKWKLVARFPAPPVQLLQLQERLRGAAAPTDPVVEQLAHDPETGQVSRATSEGHLPPETRQRAGSIAEVVAARAALGAGEIAADVALRGWQYKRLPLLNRDDRYMDMLRRLSKEGIPLFQVLPCSLCKEPWLVVPARGDFRPMLPSEVALMEDERLVEAHSSYVTGRREEDDPCSEKLSRWTGLRTAGQAICTLLGWIAIVVAPLSLLAVLALDSTEIDTTGSTTGILAACGCGVAAGLLVYVVYRVLVLSATGHITLCPWCKEDWELEDEGDEAEEQDEGAGNHQGVGGSSARRRSSGTSTGRPASPTLVEELQQLGGDSESKSGGTGMDAEGAFDLGLHHGGKRVQRAVARHQHAMHQHQHQYQQQPHRALGRSHGVVPQAHAGAQMDDRRQKQVLSPLYQAMHGQEVGGQDQYQGRGVGDEYDEESDEDEDEDEVGGPADLYLGAPAAMGEHAAPSSSSGPRSGTRSERTASDVDARPVRRGRALGNNAGVYGSNEDEDLANRRLPSGSPPRGAREPILSNGSTASRGSVGSRRAGAGAGAGGRSRRPPSLRRDASVRAMRQRSRTLSGNMGITVQ